jgi:Ca2+/Na+ antiporter
MNYTPWLPTTGDFMEPTPRPTGRENLLTIVLVLLLGGSFTFFLVMVSMGVFQYVIATVIGITLLGYLHYVLWGYSFSQQVAGEREEEEFRERMDQERDSYGRGDRFGP